ncbi:response regulator [Kineococcus sp. SYSU DK004]|uniref:response regulator n=1 Tax=Kineococcus sp. SYSU DK004 TaxID=3383125 RepID=UPI003D7CFD06
MIRVLVVDDHPVVRDGLRGVLGAADDLDVVGEAADGPSAVARALALAPDVVLMDLRMPGGDGVAAIEELARRGSPARVLVLTTYDTDADVLRAVRAGATGYLLKDAPVAELLRGVRAAARGESVLAPAVASLLVARARRPVVAELALSPRELQVLRLVARGAGNRECARRLFISEATVKTHLQHVYDKLGVGDRAAAVAAGYERGLLGPGSGPGSGPGDDPG